MKWDSNNTYRVLENADGISTVFGGNNGTITNQINSDGSGSLASGAISWDDAGTLSVNSGTVGGWTISGRTIQATKRGLGIGNVDNKVILDASNAKITVSAGDASIDIHGDSVYLQDTTSGTQYNEITATGGSFVKGNIRWSNGLGGITIDTDNVNVYFVSNGDNYKFDVAAAISAGILTQLRPDVIIP